MQLKIDRDVDEDEQLRSITLDWLDAEFYRQWDLWVKIYSALIPMSVFVTLFGMMVYHGGLVWEIIPLGILIGLVGVSAKLLEWKQGKQRHRRRTCVFYADGRIEFLRRTPDLARRNLKNLTVGLFTGIEYGSTAQWVNLDARSLQRECAGRLVRCVWDLSKWPPSCICAQLLGTRRQS